MRTTRITVTLACDAPGCGGGHPMLVLAQDYTTRHDGAAVPVPTLPAGWRERRAGWDVRHACSAACERALIDAEG